MSQPIPVGSAVYVHYVDHVLFRNMMSPIDVPVERETMGWLAKETDEIIRIHWDKTLRPFSMMNESPNSGLILLRSCILEIRALPLQDFLRWPLSCANTKDTNVESALQNEKRKTQPK